MTPSAGSIVEAPPPKTWSLYWVAICCVGKVKSWPAFLCRLLCQILLVKHFSRCAKNAQAQEKEDLFGTHKLCLIVSSQWQSSPVVWRWAYVGIILFDVGSICNGHASIRCNGLLQPIFISNQLQWLPHPYVAPIDQYFQYYFWCLLWLWLSSRQNYHLASIFHLTNWTDLANNFLGSPSFKEFPVRD